MQCALLIDFGPPSPSGHHIVFVLLTFSLFLPKNNKILTKPTQTLRFFRNQRLHKQHKLVYDFRLDFFVCDSVRLHASIKNASKSNHKFFKTTHAF